jgi:hypothetical protein
MRPPFIVGGDDQLALITIDHLLYYNYYVGLD